MSEKPDEGSRDAKFEAKKKAKAGAKKTSADRAQAKAEAKRDAKASAKSGTSRKTGRPINVKPIEIEPRDSTTEAPQKGIKPLAKASGEHASASAEPKEESQRPRVVVSGSELPIGVAWERGPGRADLAFTSTDAWGTPGPLTKRVFAVFGVDLELLQTKEDRAALKKGWAVIPALRGMTPALIAVIVTVGDRAPRELLERNLQAFLSEYARAGQRSWWLPLMGTGAGDLSPGESLSVTLRTLVRALRAIDSASWPEEVWVSVPTDAGLDGAEIKTIYNEALERSELGGTSHDTVPVHHDDPAEVDALGRAPFAAALGEHIRQWHSGEGGVPVGGAFMLHLYGPWGSGKSTLLNLLRAELQDENPEKNPVPWLFIEFNAWQNSHLDPPWWHLLDRVYREIADGDPRFRTGQAPSTPMGLWFMLMRLRVLAWIREVPLRAWERTGARAGRSWGTSAASPKDPCWLQAAYTSVASWMRSSRLRISETLWRLRAGRSWGTLCAITAGVLLGLALIATPFILGDAGRNGADGIPWVETLSGLVGLGLSVWAVSRGLVGSLIGGSGRAAEAFTLRAHDPMERIRDRFGELVQASGRPLAIVIDDLDRCSAEYVVGLLEGVQTLFRDPPVLFVVAAERRWIATSFETRYPEHSSDHDRPGHRLGYRFVQKLFQLSAPVPRLSEAMRARYWDHLLRVESGDEKVVEEQRLRAKQAMELGDSAPAVKAILDEQLGQQGDDALPEVVLREAAVKRLSSREVRESLDHALRPYARWLEPNPRAMKRLVNMYAVQSVALILEETDFEISKLVRWLQLGSRWPLLVEHLERAPEHVELEDDALKTRLAALEKAQSAIAVQQREMLRLLCVSDVQELLHTLPALTADDVRAYGGRKDEVDAADADAEADDPPPHAKAEAAAAPT